MTIAKLVSLVVATRDRTAELGRLLQSIAEQTHPHIEAIIVDQNRDNRLQPILGLLPTSRLRYLRAEPGLSHARNIGVANARGEVVGFPDDDCWYGPDVVEQVIACLHDRPERSGIAGRTLAQAALRPLWRWDSQAGPITRRNIWRRVNSNSIFLRRSVFNGGLRFDERLGVGAGTPWGSAEEVDLVASALRAGHLMEFVPNLIVFHSNEFPNFGDAEIEKAYRYACGMGYVLAKHTFPADLIILEILRPLASAVRAALAGENYKARFMAAIARGRLRGLMGNR